MTDSPAVLILMPTSGQVSTPTMKSIMVLTHRMRERGITFALETFEFSDIVFSRNYLISRLLHRDPFTHGLMVDSDMSFAEHTFFNLLEFDEEFATVPSPLRYLPLDRLRKVIELELEKPTEDQRDTTRLLAASLDYNIQGRLNQDESWMQEQRGNFVSVPGTGTGFVLIKRSVPEKMVEQKAVKYLSRHEKMPKYRETPIYDFCSHLMDKDETVLYGEDQSFCRRWVTGCNGTIWCDLSARIGHHGDFTYPGAYAETLTRSVD